MNTLENESLVRFRNSLETLSEKDLRDFIQRLVVSPQQSGSPEEGERRRRLNAARRVLFKRQTQEIKLAVSRSSYIPLILASNPTASDEELERWWKDRQRGMRDWTRERIEAEIQSLAGHQPEGKSGNKKNILKILKESLKGARSLGERRTRRKKDKYAPSEFDDKGWDRVVAEPRGANRGTMQVGGERKKSGGK